MDFRRILFAVLLLSAISGPASASAHITLNFFTPETLDPNKKIVFHNDMTQTVNGSDLTVTSALFPNVKGVEIHGSILPDVKGVFPDISSIRICFHYSGLVTAQSFGSGPPFNIYAPWTISEIHSAADPTYYCFNFAEAPGSAPINDSFNPGFAVHGLYESFATATVTGADAGLADFRKENDGRHNNGVEITPGAVPELSSVVSLGGLFAGAAVSLWLTGRRRNARCAQPAS